MAAKTPEALMDEIMGGLKEMVEEQKIYVDFNNDIEVVPTNISLLNYIMGGGIPVGKLVTITGAPGSGKALTYDTPVLTDKGWIPIKDVRVGDKVLTPEGELSTVTHEFDKGIKTTYKITFNDGSSCKCCNEHLWTVRRRSKTKWNTYSMDDILKKGITDSCGKSVWEIPYVSSLKIEDKNLPIHPYILGVLIADGCLSNDKCIFSNPDVDSDIRDFVESNLIEGYKLSVSRCGDSCPRVNICKDDSNNSKNSYYIEKVKELGLNITSGNKFIPEMYKLASDSQRLELLRGLMDCDGCAYKNRFSYSTTSKQLAEDVVYLVRSLGGFSRYTVSDRRDENKPIEYEVVVKLLVNPFKTSRKASKWNPIVARFGRYIKMVDKIEDSPCKCIKIDSEDGLFVINDFIVTHNTTLASEYISAFHNYNPMSMAFYIDTEQGMSPKRLDELGCDMKRTKLISSMMTLEGLCTTISSIIKLKLDKRQKDVPWIIIWDSESSTPTKKSLEADDPSQLLGEHSRVLAMVLNKLIPQLAMSNTTLIEIAQLRNNISITPYAPKKASLSFSGGTQKITGGSAAEYLPYQLAFISGGHELSPDEKKAEDQVPFKGKSAQIYFAKNKNFTPKIPIELVIDYRDGYNDFWTKERFLRLSGKIKGGAWNSLIANPDIKFRRLDIEETYNSNPEFKKLFDSEYEDLKKTLVSFKKKEAVVTETAPEDIMGDISASLDTVIDNQ